MKAGARTPLEIPLDAGIIELEARSPGAPVQHLIWTVLEKPDALGKQKEVTHGYDAKQEFTLLAGRYFVTARAENLTARQEIGIEAGKRIQVTLDLTPADTGKK